MKIFNKKSKNWLHNFLKKKKPQEIKYTFIPPIITRDKKPVHIWQDLYYYSLAISWPVFFCAIAIIFLLLNAMFACLFMLGNSPITNQFPPGFLGAFFFSIETMATVGYGDMHPQTLYGHIIASIDIFVGMCSVALATGVIFARFSRPSSKILFARSITITTEDNQSVLSVRIANMRSSIMTDIQGMMWMVCNELSDDGITRTKLYELPLQQSHFPALILYWTLTHIIDKSSPLYGKTQQQLNDCDTGIILNVEGFDSTTAQIIHGEHLWSNTKILWQQRYIDLIHTDNHVSYVNWSHFDETVPM
ncbi:Inward rectifier potassium channel [Serratia sp. S1B]|nr:Inward rectifier potassium channel [Serratia sp. S1B]